MRMEANHSTHESKSIRSRFPVSFLDYSPSFGLHGDDEIGVEFNHSSVKMGFFSSSDPLSENLILVRAFSL